MSINIPYRKFVLVLGLLLFISILYTTQNYLKFSHNAGYLLGKSFLYNLILVGGFALVSPLIWKVNQHLSSFRKWVSLGFNLLLIIGVILLYVTLISLILYQLGFLSKPFHGGFYLKYFSNVVIIHLIFYLLILKFLPSNTPKSETIIEALSGKKKIKIKSADILFIQSLDHYVKIKTDDHLYIKKISMRDLLKILEKRTICTNS